MEYLWTSEDLIAATGGRPVGAMPEGITGISIDTRTIGEGEAFFAIKGDQFDGHSFIGNAMKAGAGLAVVSEEKLVALGQYKLPLVVVHDVLEAMERLGQAARARSKAQIVAVTGSVGKTTVKEMLRTVLAECGSVHASAASFNNHWGVPLTLARMPEDTRFGVFEIGMNHPNEIRPLVKMVRPHVAIITTVAAAHLGAFSGLDEIARAKAEILEGLVPGGYAILNRDNNKLPLLKKLAQKAGVDHILTFGEKRGATFSLKSIEQTDEGQHVKVRLRGDDAEFLLPAPGRHMVFNALCALGAASLMGAEVDKVAKAFVKVMPEKGRGETHHVDFAGKLITIIDETYNANPASMAAALKVLGETKPGDGGKRIAVLGDMLELGPSSPKLHAGLYDDLIAAGVDQVFLAGDEIASLHEALDKKAKDNGMLGGYFTTAAKLLPELKSAIGNGDVIMLKASNGLKFATLVNALLGKKGN